MEKFLEYMLAVMAIFLVISIGYILTRFTIDNSNQNLKGSYIISVSPTPSPINIPLRK